MKVLKFSTPTCMYCKITSPRVNEWAKTVDYEVEDIDATGEGIIETYDITSVPTVIILDGANEEVARYIGAEDIMGLVNK